MYSPSFQNQRPTERVSQAALTIATRNGQRDFEAIRTLLLDWLRKKVGADLPAAMARGETDALDQVDVPRTETVLLADPLFWAFRRDDPDLSYPQRTWVTEASLSFVDGKLHVGYRLHLVNRGEPAPFQRSVPRFMREIARNYTTCLDGVETDLTATPVEWDDEVGALVRLLDDAARKVPVIAVSSDLDDNGQEQTLLDADKLASAVFGTAHVRALSWKASLALTERVGKRLSVYRGAVRLWRPGTRIEESDPYDHPLFLAERIGDDGPQVVFRTIVDGTLRVSAARRDAEKLAPPFAEARRAAVAPGREQAARAASSAQDLLALYEVDNKELTNLVAELKADHAEFVELADAELNQVCSERDAARTEIANLRSRLAYLEHRRFDQPRAASVPIPDDFGELEAWVTEHLDSTVHVLPRALRAARKSPYENPSLAYRALLLLRDAYVPMRRGEVEDGQQRWTDGLMELGLTLTPSFSGSGAGQFGDEYYVDWNGRRRELEWHLKGNSSREPRYGFRLYFFWCDDARCPVVGSFPSHLTTNLT